MYFEIRNLYHPAGGSVEPVSLLYWHIVSSNEPAEKMTVEEACFELGATNKTFDI